MFHSDKYSETRVWPGNAFYDKNMSTITVFEQSPSKWWSTIEILSGQTNTATIATKIPKLFQTFKQFPFAY